MKNLILLLAVSLITITGFSQSFSYETKQVLANGTPSWSADSLTITYPYIVTVGIVGEPYGFVAPNAGKNMFTFSLSTKEAKSPETLQKYAWSKADEWVKENYPDMK